MPLDEQRNTPLVILKNINRNILSGLRYIGLDFFQDEPKPELKDKESPVSPKPKEPEIIDIVEPPLESPPNRIELPPRQIYPDSPIAPITIPFTFIPELPQRILPDADKVSTDTTRTYSSTSGDKLYNHKFGCMLARPYYNESLEFCLTQPLPDFWQNLQSLIESKLDKLVSDLETDNNANSLDKAFVYLHMPETDYPFQLRSVEAIKSIDFFYFKRNKNVANYPITGMLSTGGVTLTECDPQLTAPQRDDFELQSQIEFNEAGIPLSLYDNNLGKKGDQIQLLFRNTSLKSQYRQITIPFAKDFTNATIDQIRAIAPTSFDFGHIVQVIQLNNTQNANLARGGILKIFTTNENKDSQNQFVNNFVQTLVNNFCINGIQISYGKASNYSSLINTNVNTYPIHKVIYMGYSDDDNKWIEKGHWKLS